MGEIMDRISKMFRLPSIGSIVDRDNSSLLERISFHHAQRSDLLSLEWEGEFSHFRRLYSEAYRIAELGQAVIWIAELNKVGVIGQLFVHLRSDRKDLADGETSAYIYGFRIRPAYQSKGIGTRLLEIAENDLVFRGYRIVNLNVGQDNQRARMLYERLGYRVIGSDPGRWSYYDQYGRRQDVNEPAWRMQKELYENNE
jgi:ribosomal protein S18 acetylase RimI-like enzyme